MWEAVIVIPPSAFASFIAKWWRGLVASPPSIICIPSVSSPLTNSSLREGEVGRASDWIRILGAGMSGFSFLINWE